MKKIIAICLIGMVICAGLGIFSDDLSFGKLVAVFGLLVTVLEVFGFVSGKKNSNTENETDTKGNE